jgi:hypothetical protein
MNNKHSLMNTNNIFSFFWVMIFTIFCVGCGSCQNQIGVNVVTKSGELSNGDHLMDSILIKVESSKQYRFVPDNTDQLGFGFKHNENDQALGIRNVVLFNEFAYFSDPVHQNVKKIDIKSGKISCSSKLNFGIREMAVFKNLIFVFSDNEMMYLLDTNLSLVNQVELKSFRFEKTIFNISDEGVFLYRPAMDVYNGEANTLVVQYRIVSEDGIIKSDSLTFPNYEDYLANFPKNRGQGYSEIVYHGESALMKGNRIFQLPKKIPTTSKFYDSRNFDFNNGVFVFYSSMPQEFIVDFIFWKNE